MEAALRHLGNVTVTHENYPDFPPGEEVFGHVTIGSLDPKTTRVSDAGLTSDVNGFRVDTGRLTLIRGWLTLMPGTQVIAPQLGLIDGWLELKDNCTFISSALREIRQDLIVGHGCEVMFEDLRTVQLSIALWHNVVLELPELVSVGNIALRPGAQLIAPKLLAVNGSITMQKNSAFNAPELMKIGKYLDADPLARLVAPKFGAHAQ